MTKKQNSNKDMPTYSHHRIGVSGYLRCKETKSGRLADDIQKVVNVEVKVCHLILIRKFVKFVS